MANKMLNAFDVWITAQGVKSRTRLRSVDNISLEGVARLRELILEFAIQGKLVPQNSKDEPAAILLAKMTKEESELVQKKIIKKSKKLPPIEESEFPFELPKGWAYTRLNNIGEWGAGATPLRGRGDYYGGDIPWFKSGELSGDFISKSEETVTELALKQTSLRYNKVGDVLIAMYGATIGKSSILEVPATTNQAVCACTPFSGVYNVFLLKLLRAYNNRFINMGAGGAQPNISREKIIATVIALPPLAEQHRIVAKVDELMALCDALEQQDVWHLKSHRLLVETLLCTLARVADAKEFQQAWNKLYEHFDDLFTTEDSIDQLKQTILQLAVMGKLVPQDPNDEPASELLKQIQTEKNRLVDDGLVRKQKLLPLPSEDDKPFSLVSGWEWCRIHDITTYIQRGKGPKYADTGSVMVISQKCIQWSGFDISKAQFVDEESLNKYQAERFLMRGDLLWNSTGTGTVGRVNVLNEVSKYRLVADSHVTVIRPLKVNPNFLWCYLASPEIQTRITELGSSKSLVSGTTNQVELNTSSVVQLNIPLPPLREQHRIVAKVKELFALCDRLKERIAKAQKVASHMADSILEQVNE